MSGLIDGEGQKTNGAAKRRQWGPEEKFEIVVRSLTGDEPNIEICRRFGISEPTLYNWRQQFFEGGKLYLEERSRRSIEALKQENTRLKEIIVDLYVACHGLEVEADGACSAEAARSSAGFQRRKLDPGTVTRLKRQRPRDWSKVAMKLRQVIGCVAVWGALLVALPASAAPILVLPGDQMGSRSTPTDVVAADGWTGPNGGFAISWDITFSSGLWHYKYTVTDADGDPLSPNASHLLIEVSTSITEDNVDSIIFNENFTLQGPKTWTKDPLAPGNTSPGGNNANPNLPADIYAIKADTGSDVVGGMYTFDSTRAPIWGDFYTKDGKHDGIVATAWNSGIGTDPTAQTTSFAPWIPVPDTFDTAIAPLPGSIALLALGGLAAVVARRRR